ncbi:MAG: glutathione S-transferase family protein [Pseudomonadota bacterium]
MTKYRLHNRLGSGGFAVQAALTLAGIDFDYEPIASLPNDAVANKIGRLNPWGQVPVLELETGARITEVAAILGYLAQSEPTMAEGPALWVDDWPSFHRWTTFLAVNVYEAILRRSYPERFFTALEGEASDEMNAVMRAQVCDAANARCHQALLCLEAETAGHDYLLSDRLSPCDLFLAQLYAWHNPKPDLPKCTWITRQIATHAAIRPLWKQNFERFLDVKWHEMRGTRAAGL